MLSLHKGKTEEEHISNYDLVELVADPSNQIGLHGPAHPDPVHLLTSFHQRENISYHGLVYNHEDKDGKHGVEYALVVGLLDPRVVLNEVE